MPARSPARLTPAEAADALRSPRVAEDLVAEGDETAVVVEGDWSAVPSAAEPAWFDALREIPTVTVAVAGSPLGPTGGLLAAGFDVLLVEDGVPAPDGAAPADALSGLLESVADRPLAALVLVQLLRAGAGGNAGLLAESLGYGLLQSGPEFAAWLASHEREPPPPSGPPMQVERAGDCLEVVLDRPAVRNALDTEMRDALVEVFTAAAADPTVASIVWRGEGPAFCSGGALWEFGTVPDPPTGHLVRSTRLPARAVARCSARLRARVHGACVGAGVELPAFAARVEAEPDTTFRLPEVAMGLVPGAGGTVSLPRRIGRHRTAFMGLTGQAVDAETALSWGLVDELLSGAASG